MASAMAGSGRGSGQQRSHTKHAGPAPAKHARRPRVHVDGVPPPSEEGDALPAALAFEVDASREPAEPDGMVDDYPSIDREPRDDVDEPDSIGGRRR